MITIDTSRPVMPIGPESATIMIVGEAPGADEEERGRPFVGASGYCLDKMLEDVGLLRSNCYITNVFKHHPPRNDLSQWIADKKKNVTADHVHFQGRMVLPYVVEQVKFLHEEIANVKPNIIIVLGGTALWACTENMGIQKWRGSMLEYGRGNSRILPTYHPAAINRQWQLRRIALWDLRRAREFEHKSWPKPEWNFIIQPSLATVLDTLSDLRSQADAWDRKAVHQSRMPLSVDIETRAGHIACLGIAWDTHNAICIPFMQLGKPSGYWTAEEETAVVHSLYRLLTHPAVGCIGQNFIYDAQYIHRAFHFIPNFLRDTMVGQHTLFPGMQKSLDFICSMHNDQYIFWKDDGKTLSLDGDERKHWAYNCEDCVRTLEADLSLVETADSMGMRGPFDFQQSLFGPVLKMMLRGFRVDRYGQAVIERRLIDDSKKIGAWITRAVGYALNPKSPKQMAEFFYKELALPKIYSKKSAAEVPGLTCDSEALAKLCKRQPLLAPLVSRIEDLRSIGVFTSNYLSDKRDSLTGRVHCSFYITGTKTFRFASGESAFGSGLNMQTIPKGDEE